MLTRNSPCPAGRTTRTTSRVCSHLRHVHAVAAAAKLRSGQFIQWRLVQWRLVCMQLLVVQLPPVDAGEELHCVRRVKAGVWNQALEGRGCNRGSWRWSNDAGWSPRIAGRADIAGGLQWGRWVAEVRLGCGSRDGYQVAGRSPDIGAKLTKAHR